MKNIALSAMVVFSFSFAAWYFTTQDATANQEMIQVEKGLFMEVLEDNKQLKERVNQLTGVALKLFWRLERLEEKAKMSVPPELTIEVKK